MVLYSIETFRRPQIMFDYITWQSLDPTLIEKYFYEHLV